MVGAARQLTGGVSCGGAARGGRQRGGAEPRQRRAEGSRVSSTRAGVSTNTLGRSDALKSGCVVGWRGCLLSGCDALRPLLTELPVVAVMPHNPQLWTALWGECDGHFCLLVYTTCDSVNFPMPMLVVFTAVICGEAHYASGPGGFSAECALLADGPGEHADC